MANKFLNGIDTTSLSVNSQYSLPTSDGSNGQVLKTDGSGNVTFSDGADSGFVFYTVKNSTGSTIAKGTGVYASGTDGNSGHILISPMVADGTIEPKYFIGITKTAITNGSIGQVVHFGEIDQINTSTYTDGDVLWCDPSNDGGFTTTEPTGPNLKLAVAIVINASTNGKIRVRVQGNEGLHELHDVNISSQANGDLLQWNATSGVWENKTLASIADSRYVNVSGDTMTGQLRLDGSLHIDTATNTQPLIISRLGSLGTQLVKIGVTDTTTDFLYIEDTTSEGNGNFGSYRFMLGGNDGESNVVPLTIDKEGIDVNGAITANSFVKNSGTSSQFLKADGSVDSNTYLTSLPSHNHDSDYVNVSGDTMTGLLTFRGNTSANNELQRLGAGGGSGNYTTLDFIKTSDTNGDFVIRSYHAGIGSTTSSPKIIFGHYAPTPTDGHVMTIDTKNERVGIGTLTPEATLQVEGSLKVVGGIYVQNSTDHGAVLVPEGGYYKASTSTNTGAIKITLPTHGTADMIGFTVDIYDYTVDESITVFIKGYLYQTTGNNEWVNPSAQIIASKTDREYTVRFGSDGSNNCVWIGETNTVWTWLQVQVRDFFGGFSTDIDAYDNGWSVSVVTAFDTVDESLSDTFPQARNADTVDGLHASQFLRSDTNSTINGAFTVNGGTGSAVLNVNASGDSFVEKDNGNHLYFANNAQDKNIYLRVNDGGTYTNALTITGSSTNADFTGTVSSTGVVSSGVIKSSYDGSGVVSPFEASGDAFWYMYGFGARGASAGAYGIGLKSDIADRTLSIHVPNHAAYGSTGSVPKIGFYSNGALELFTVESHSGDTWIKGDLTVAGNTIAVGGTSTGANYGVFLQNNKWLATQYSPTHDIVRINANTTGGLDVYNQTDSAFASIRAGGFEVSGGTSSQFLKADGSLDSTSYLSSLPTHNHDDRYFRRYSGSVSGVDNTGYTTAFTVDGGNLASSIRFSVQGTANNVVVSNLIDLVVNHSEDIMIKAQSGVYTQLTVKVVSNNNEDFAVEFKTNSANAVTLYVEVLSYGDESVTFTSSHSYTGSTLEHTCTAGFSHNGRGGDTGTIRTQGEIISADDIRGASFVKSGGTSSQFLKADGSVDANSYLTTTGKAADSNLLDGIDSTGFFRDLGDTGTVTDFDNLSVGINHSNETTATNQPYANHNITLTFDNDASAGRMAQIYMNDTALGGIWFRPKQGTSGWHDWSRLWGSYDFTSTDIANWDTAYGWGNHADGGYLQSYTETDTLDSVADRGNSTNQELITSSHFTSSNSLALRDYATDARIHLGNASGGASGVFAGRRLTDSDGLRYGTYWAYDCYWDDTAQEWNANRTTLGRKWKAEMGFHLNEFAIYNFNGTVSSAWADSDWTKLFTVDSAGNASATGGVYGTSFVKSGGTSSQFLKANGSVDSTEYFPTSGGTITGSTTVQGDLYVGGVNSQNFIAFRGTTGDQPGNFNHTYIGERIWGGTEQSELLLFKGNDPAASSGPDRIRHIGSEHIFQTYSSALSGSFADIGSSTAPDTKFKVHNNGDVVIGSEDAEGKLDIIGSPVNGTQAPDWSGDGISYNSYGDVTISRRHGATKDSSWGYTGPNIDFRSSNTSNQWSVAQIMGTTDPLGGSNHAGGLMFLTSSGGTTNPTGRRNQGSAPQVRMAIGPSGDTVIRKSLAIGQDTVADGVLHLMNSAGTKMRHGLYGTIGNRYSNWDTWIGNNVSVKTNSTSGLELLTGFTTAGASAINVGFGNFGYYQWTASDLSGLGAGSTLSIPTPSFYIDSSKNTTINGSLKVTDTTTGIHVDTSGHASVRIDRGSTSFDNNLLFYTAGALDFRIWQDGSSNYLYVRDETGGGGNMVTFKKGGNVGIGIDPTARLHVAGGNVFIAESGFGIVRGGADDAYHGMTFRGYPSAQTTLAMTAADVMSFWEYGGDFRFYQKSATTFSQQGQLLNGTWRVSGDVVAYYSFSDERLKENVEKIDSRSALDQVLNLQGVTFTWKDGQRQGEKQIGFIAQEVEKVVPEVVREQERIDDQTFKTVDYENMVALLTEAIKEQQKQIDELKAMINGNA